MATQTLQKEFGLANGAQNKKVARMRQIFEVQTWGQVRGFAGAVLCETRDFGHQMATMHTLIFEGQVAVDMRYVCPKDAKKMLLKRARSTYWKKWAAKHEYAELKEGILLEPALALLRRKTKEEWTDKHRNVARNLVPQGLVTRRKVHKNMDSAIV